MKYEKTHKKVLDEKNFTTGQDQLTNDGVPCFKEISISTGYGA